MNSVPWFVVRSLEWLEAVREEIANAVFPDRDSFLLWFGQDIGPSPVTLVDREILAAADRLYGPVA